MGTIDKVEIAGTFIAVPYRIHGRDKAEQVALAVGAVFQTQATVFNGGDGWYVLAEKNAEIESDHGTIRMENLMWMLERLHVTPDNERYLEQLGMDCEERHDAAALLVDRGIEAINLQRTLTGMTEKLEAIWDVLVEEATESDPGIESSVEEDTLATV